MSAFLPVPNELASREPIGEARQVHSGRLLIQPHDVPTNELVFLFGAARSGTSWIGKIFDSHPDAIYRHEPDFIANNRGLPWICLSEEELRRESAYRYIQDLARTATVKTVGSAPLFRKRDQGRIRWLVRRGAVLLLQVAQQPGATRKWARQTRIPDFLPGSARPLRVVIKSIGALGRVPLFANAAPDGRFALIVRDPRAQVASMLRGFSLKKFDKEASVEAMVVTPQAKRYGLTEQRLGAMKLEEQLTWSWVVMYEKAMEDMARLRHRRIIRYDDFVKDPLANAKDIFDFAGLPWNLQTENFILESTRSKGKNKYYGVYRNPNDAANSWRRELTDDQKKQIRSIVQATSLDSFLQD